MALYTLRHKVTGEIKVTTDGCRGWRTGLWSDLDRCKTPSLRGVGSRGEYFRNGIAETLDEVVLHYEAALGFAFTDQERNDLVAFLEAL
jgi:cytochrome c peroxidase